MTYISSPGADLQCRASPIATKRVAGSDVKRGPPTKLPKPSLQRSSLSKKVSQKALLDYSYILLFFHYHFIYHTWGNRLHNQNHIWFWLYNLLLQRQLLLLHSLCYDCPFTRGDIPRLPWPGNTSVAMLLEGTFQEVLRWHEYSHVTRGDIPGHLLWPETTQV